MPIFTEGRFTQVRKGLGRFLFSPGPIELARRRKRDLERERSTLTASASPDEHAQLSALIDFEEEFIRSMSERAAEIRKRDYSVSAKGILQLLGLSVLVLFVVVWLR